MEPPSEKRDATQEEIQEILRKRRETLRRVRVDLDKVSEIQRTFQSRQPIKQEPDNRSEP